MRALTLALRFARRELRSGLSGFRIFLAALTLGVAAIAGVGSLGQSFLTGLSEQGRTLLGGDIRLQRLYQPATDSERKFMAAYGPVTEAATLRSMAGNSKQPDKRTLIELKAVDGTYPLVGQTTLAPAMPLQTALACDAAACGAVAEEALLVRIGLKPGDAIHIGNADFILRAQIVSEPDRVAGGFALGPHVLIGREGLTRAGLITPGSLINYIYRIAFTGKTATGTFRKQMETAFPDGTWAFDDSTNALPQVARFVEQATMFLTLVGLTALVVAGVGAGQAVGAFLERRRATIATLKALGAEGNEIFLIYLIQVMAMAGLGLALGLALGATLPFAVAHFAGDAIPVPAHFAVYSKPLIMAAVFGTLAALGSAIPPLARAREIAPAGLFRDLVAPSSRHARWPYLFAAAAAFGTIAALSVWLSPYRLFTLAFLGGTLGVLIGLRLIAFAVRRGLMRLPRSQFQLLRLALANLTRPGTPTASIIVALGLGLTLLATVVLMQASLDAQIEDQLPAKAPSFFFVDIQQDQIDAFTKLLSGFRGAEDFNATPMMRGRIVKLKGVPINQVPVAADARWAVNSDRAVTYTASKPKNAHVVEGPDWWPADYQGEELVSFDRNLARGMGVKIGDIITINLIGRDIDLRIFNLRDIDFRTGGINFVLTTSPGVIASAPHSFLATVRAPPAQEDALFTAVSRAFPNVTVVRVREALSQVGELLAELVRGIEIASLITILAGVLVLAGAIAAGHRARLYDAVVLKVLGATRAKLGAVYAVEYGLLGALAGCAALIAGTTAAWAVAHWVLDVPFVFAGRAVLFTIAGGAVGTLILGLSGGFAALATKPAARLRNP
ncbi:MAG TPA: FtsX-like permease family protein [Micropepsaceae bacterium]|jgi:putative ABC transport system permease protein|nr:FtsX-like permease family protein [Micropepsaceae bacterium]